MLIDVKVKLLPWLSRVARMKLVQVTVPQYMVFSCLLLVVVTVDGCDKTNVHNKDNMYIGAERALSHAALFIL